MNLDLKRAVWAEIIDQDVTGALGKSETMREEMTRELSSLEERTTERCTWSCLEVWTKLELQR